MKNMKKVITKKYVKGKTFEENYFDGYYKKMVGEFSNEDLIRSEQWFWGWITFLDRYIDLKTKTKRKILEVGCSIGGAAKIFNERGFNVFASDISKLAVEKAQKNLPDITFFTWDVEKKSPRKESFDLIFGFEVIEHLPNPTKSLKNIRAALLPKGQVVFSTPFPYDYVYTDPTHISVKSPGEWLRVFEDAGFSNIKMQPAVFLPVLYKISKHFSLALPFTVNSRYINSTLFIIAQK